ncbi:CPBP family intramembrane glutamic endopeptidase [Bacillus horti]|uniref:Membrane protease YdiL (CAAX protease family) n=1 Tax=Caldalkalibacillus horti TaxID=77523 RepID=A0ABT9W3X2_9BACI|nr:type II CAAX endopeptidase family protein [Bacillus horti]MDQ0167953.1 membrane protease YdiL (CAAX protease family) [Bacillus horti]
MEQLEQIFQYSLRITPGLILITLTYLLLPQKTVMAKLFLLVFGFILVRDAMTPMGFWRFGVSENTVWVRFIEDGLILTTLGIISLLFTVAIVYLNPKLKEYLVWFGQNKLASIGMGLAGAVIVILPFLYMYNVAPVELRGGIVPTNLIVPLLVLALFGNLMEEVLFRGYLQGYFEKITGPWRAAILSGLLFALGHIFLSATVTDLGIAILIFTLYEGMVCAFVRMKYGIIASTLTHGLTIFVLASGLL